MFLRLLAALSIAGMVFVAAAPARAQKAAAKAPAAAPAGGGPMVQYEKKTVYDFDDDVVEGELQRPDGEMVNVGDKTAHSSLIQIRENFIPEMLKSAENI